VAGFIITYNHTDAGDDSPRVLITHRMRSKLYSIYMLTIKQQIGEDCQHVNTPKSLL